MNQPLDIRVTATQDRGLVVTIEGMEVNTADMENSAVLWEIVSYIVNRMPDDGHMEALRIAAIQMTDHFRQAAERARQESRIRQEAERAEAESRIRQEAERVEAESRIRQEAERVEAESRIRQRENGVEGLDECPLPPDECPICFEPHSEGAQWVTLRHCGHCFHFDCISGWREPTCPLCRNGYTRNTRQRAV